MSEQEQPKKPKKPKKPKVPRQKMPEQEPAERRSNFREVPHGLPPMTAVVEANRCIQCKKPKCVEGCQFDNLGLATGMDPGGRGLEATDPSHYCNPPEPAITIEKATNGIDADDPNAGDAPQIGIGNLVTWTYVVTNTGNVPFTFDQVDDVIEGLRIPVYTVGFEADLDDILLYRP